MVDGISLTCPQCGERFSLGERMRCPTHGNLLEIDYDIEILRDQFDPTQCSRSDIWRYDSLLPVESQSPVTLGEGWTPLVDAPTTGEELDVSLSLKLEGANPTGSSKDRGSAVVATQAVQSGASSVVCASTGNAAASIAAYAARGSLDCSLFVPERLPEGKAVQPRVYGAELRTVEGSYADAADACRAYGSEPGRIDRSAGTNPFVPAGTRTLGFELAEQTDSTDWLAVSMGNGGTIADSWQGWKLFERLGYAESTPRLLGVQAASSTAIHNPERSPTEETATCADSIDVDEPHRKADARVAIDQSGGKSVAVSDEAIRNALRTLGSNEGVFAEPASAAAVAGIQRAREDGIIDSGESVVAIITGNGLKDTATAAASLDSKTD